MGQQTRHARPIRGATIAWVGDYSNVARSLSTGALKLGALTVLIGNNGSGKSSLIEALETYQRIVTHGLDDAKAVLTAHSPPRTATSSHILVEPSGDQAYC